MWIVEASRLWNASLLFLIQWKTLFSDSEQTNKSAWMISLAEVNPDPEQLRACQPESEDDQRMTSALSITPSTKKAPVRVPERLKSTGESQASKRCQRTLIFESTENFDETAR